MNPDQLTKDVQEVLQDYVERLYDVGPGEAGYEYVKKAYELLDHLKHDRIQFMEVGR